MSINEISPRKVNKYEDTIADNQLDYFFTLSSQFESTKGYLKKYSSYVINTLFSYLGYQYKGEIENTNILHLSAEAWLLGLFKELKNECKELNEKEIKAPMTYKRLLNQVNQIIVQEQDFIDNVNLLTGIYGVAEPALEDGRILKVFLVNIHIAKQSVLKDSELLDDELLTEKDFNNILFRIFLIAFNYSLNEFNSEQTDKKHIELFELYQDLKQKEDEANKLTLDRFIKTYFEIKKIKPETQISLSLLKIHLASYFRFIETDLDLLLKEIELFNSNAGSVLYKIKNLLSFNNIKRISSKYYELLTNLLTTGAKNLKLESVLLFYNSAYLLAKDKTEQSLALAKTKYIDAKQWIVSSYEKIEIKIKPILTNVKEQSYIYYQNALKLTEKPRHLFIDGILIPVVHYSAEAANNSIKFVIDTSKLGKEKAQQIVDFVLAKTSETYNIIKKPIIGEDPLVKVDYHSRENKYISVAINKKLFFADPQRILDFINNILQEIKQFNIQETAVKVYTKTRDTIVYTKNYIILSYKKFLDLASEEEYNEEICTDSKGGKEIELSQLKKKN